MKKIKHAHWKNSIYTYIRVSMDIHTYKCHITHTPWMHLSMWVYIHAGTCTSPCTRAKMSLYNSMHRGARPFLMRRPPDGDLVPHRPGSALTCRVTWRGSLSVRTTPVNLPLVSPEPLLSTAAGGTLRKRQSSCQNPATASHVCQGRTRSSDYGLYPRAVLPGSIFCNDGMFWICAIQYSSHQPRVAIEHLKCG